MFEAIHRLLLRFDNQNLTQDDWRQLFKYEWQKKDEPPGYVLLDKDKIVGFIGFIFCTRTINGKERKFCNITSWIVLKEYRSQSIMLLYESLKLKNCTLTNLTCTKEVHNISRKLGFKELETKSIVIFSLPSLWNILGRGKHGKVLREELDIEKCLTGESLKLYRDHLSYKCGQIVLNANKGCCHVVFNRIKKYRVGCSRILYISNNELFLKYSKLICGIIRRINGTVIIMVDKRLVGDVSKPLWFESKLRVPRLYKSDSLSCEDVDNLYSELVVLNI